MTRNTDMMWAPFIANNDDMLSQLAQLQIFVTLLSSLALRAMPPSVLAGSIVSALLLEEAKPSRAAGGEGNDVVHDFVEVMP